MTSHYLQTNVFQEWVQQKKKDDEDSPAQKNKKPKRSFPKDALKITEVVKKFWFCCAAWETAVSENDDDDDNNHTTETLPHVFFPIFFEKCCGRRLHISVEQDTRYKQFAQQHASILVSLYAQAEELSNGREDVRVIGDTLFDYSHLILYEYPPTIQVKTYGEFTKCVNITTKSAYNMLMGLRYFGYASILMYDLIQTDIKSYVIYNTNVEKLYATFQKTFHIMFERRATTQQFVNQFIVVPINPSICLLCGPETIVSSFLTANLCTLFSSNPTPRTNSFLGSPFIVHSFLHGSVVQQWSAISAAMRWMFKSGTKHIPSYSSELFELTISRLPLFLDLFGSPETIVMEIRKSLQRNNISDNSSGLPTGLKFSMSNKHNVLQSIVSFIFHCAPHKVSGRTIREVLAHIQEEKSQFRNATKMVSFLQDYLSQTRPTSGTVEDGDDMYKTEAFSVANKSVPVHFVLYSVALDINTPFSLKKRIATTTLLSSDLTLLSPGRQSKRGWLHSERCLDMFRSYSSEVKVVAPSASSEPNGLEAKNKNKNKTDSPARSISPVPNIEFTPNQCNSLFALFQMLEWMNLDKLLDKETPESRFRQTEDAFVVPISPDSIDFSSPFLQFPLFIMNDTEIVYSHETWAQFSSSDDVASFCDASLSHPTHDVFLCEEGSSEEEEFSKKNKKKKKKRKKKKKSITPSLDNCESSFIDELCMFRYHEFVSRGNRATTMIDVLQRSGVKNESLLS
ncbi:MAG: hypothetical protein ACTSUE_22950 [Promethearchaeota archaeon]